jgi:hypothetical protein
MEFDDLAILGRAERVSAEGIRFDAVRFMEGARDAITVEVRAEKHGNDLFFGMHCI